jgi:serine/threonine protein phosphatase PrpC
MERVITPPVEWAAASRPLDPEEGSGDQYLVRATPNGVLVVVADGVGHGREAAEAARAAIALVADAEGEGLIGALRRSHQGLRLTRGAALSLAWFDGARRDVTWIGIGNVTGILVRSSDGGERQETLLLRGGVLGRNLPVLRAETLTVFPGDTLVLATDGIHPRFAAHLRSTGSPKQLADHILDAHGTGDDDALVVVARYRGGS